MQAEGGTHGDTVMLCSNGHDMAHKQARVKQSRHGKTRTKNYFPPDLYARGMQIVDIMLRGATAYQIDGDKYEDYAILAVSVPISPRQRKRLQYLKSHNGFSNMEDFLKSIIAKLTGVKSIPKDDMPEM